MKATTEVHGLKPIFKNGGSSGKKWVAPARTVPGQTRLSSRVKVCGILCTLFSVYVYISTTRSETATVEEYPAMNSFSVLLRALVLFVIASRGSSRSPSLRVTPPDSFDYTLKGESLKLIKVKDDGRVSQLQDISPGVYSLKLAGTRTGGCGFKGGSDGAYR